MDDVSLLQSPLPLAGQTEAEFKTEWGEGHARLTREHWPEWETICKGLGPRKYSDQAKLLLRAGVVDGEAWDAQCAMMNADPARELRYFEALAALERPYRAVDSLARFLAWLDERIGVLKSIERQDLLLHVGKSATDDPMIGTRKVIGQALTFADAFGVDRVASGVGEIATDVSLAGALELLDKLRLAARAKAESETPAGGGDGKGETKAGGEGETKVLDKESMVILKVLANSDTFLTQVEIAERTDETDDNLGKKLDRGTVSTRLRELESQGYVNRPKGKRKGWVITPKGRALIPH